MSDDRVGTIAQSLGMDEPENAEALRKEIRAEMRDLHPDTNEGDFADTESRDRFAELSNALAELDGGSASALVPLSTVAPMVQAIAEALDGAGPGMRREAFVADQRQTLVEEARAEARARFKLSRLGSVSFALVTTVLLLLPSVTAAWGNDSVSAALNASIIAPLFANPLFEPVFFGLALYSWLFFGLTWFMEQNDLARIDWVITDEARGLLLRRAVLEARQRGEQESITKADLRQALGQRLKPVWLLRLLGARDVSPSFLDRVVTQHVAELQQQDVLASADEAALSPRYRVAESVTKSIQP